MPDKGTKMKFKNYKNMTVRPYVVYADVESTLAKVKDKDKISKHVPNSCCYYFVCEYDESKNIMRTFVGENCIVEMLKELAELSDKCIEEMRKVEK